MLELWSSLIMFKKDCMSVSILRWQWDGLVDVQNEWWMFTSLDRLSKHRYSRRLGDQMGDDTTAMSWCVCR